MKLRPPLPPVVQLIPALIAKRGKGGTSFRGADQYDQDKEGATLLDTNLEGLTPRERARGVAHLRAGSRVKRAVDHWSISLDPRHGKLADDQWRQVCHDFINDMGYRGCAYTLTHHVDEPQDHIHLTLLRIRPDGTTVSDANDFKRSHEAAARCAVAIGLHPLPPRHDAAWMPAPTDAQIGANKRATRRGTKTQNHASLARTFDHIVSKSVDLADLETKLREVDVELQIVRKSGGSVQGLNVKFADAEEWLKASGLKKDRSLSWPKVEACLASNRELRERAQAQAEQVAGAARERAEHRVAARLDKQPQPVSQPARAMLPGTIDQAKEATMTDTTLDFLNPPPPPRPDDVPLDDAGLVPTTLTGSAANGEAQARHKKKLEVMQEDRDRARDQAELDMLAALKRLSVKELLDLRSTVSPLVMSLASIEALINLMIRLFTLGLVKRVNTLGDALAARAELAERAEKELGRRRRSPATVADRIAALNEYAEAVEGRGKMLVDRHSLRTMPDAHAGARRARAADDLRARVRAAFDRKRVAAALPTIEQRQAEHNAAREAHRRARAENDLVPAGFTGLLITKTQRDAGVAAKAAAVLALRQAAERRETAKAQLQMLIDEVEAVALEHEQQAAEQAVAAEKAEALERDALARELRALPEQIREVGAAAQRVQHQERAAALVAEHNRPKTPAELEAVEAERLRQLALANRRG